MPSGLSMRDQARASADTFRKACRTAGLTSFETVVDEPAQAAPRDDTTPPADDKPGNGPKDETGKPADEPKDETGKPGDQPPAIDDTTPGIRPR